MMLRQALIEQAPSLVLQRAAADEIARLDAVNAELLQLLQGLLQLTAEHNPNQGDPETDDPRVTAAGVALFTYSGGTDAS